MDVEVPALSNNKILTFDVSNATGMISSFASKETEQIWNGFRVKSLPYEIQEISRRKLRMLNSAQNLSDLRIPPSNRLEKLSGNLNGFYSIRVNKQWRIVFRWLEGMAENVEIVDYH